MLTKPFGLMNGRPFKKIRERKEGHLLAICKHGLPAK